MTELPQQHRALQLRDAQLHAFRALGIIRLYRRRIADHVRAMHMRRIVADADRHAKLREPARERRFDFVRTGHHVTFLEHDLR
ncbi:hypothetical protein SDC9_192839 [bioreactor metagenome]|uniref:Uncharacterized protein n=1 Tax=bioreactor metagenome TaxID=1076179 RepID=A0A645I3B8_9ZZZZ